MNFDLDDILKLRKDSVKHQAKWRDDAREAFKFRDGDQWDRDDVAKLEDENRPVVTFNRVGPIIDAVKGYELGNRHEVRYMPRTGEDTGVNEVFTGAAQWIRDGCDAEDEESDSYDDMITAGLGWVETRVDYEVEADGQIIMERVPPLEMRWDYNANRRNILDRTWDSREKWLPQDEVEERWPDADLGGVTEDLFDDDIQPHDASNAWKYENSAVGDWKRKGQLLVIHFQYKERETYYRVGDPESGKIIEFPEDKFKKAKKHLDRAGIHYVKQKRWVFKQKFIHGNEVLEEGDCPVQGFSRQAMTAKRDEESGLWFGMMRAMIDPQKWANKFFAQTMHIFNSNPKGGVILEDGAVDDVRKFEESWADPSGVSWVAEGALSAGKVQDKKMSGYPSQLDRLLQFAISSIRDTSGINVELLGMVDREQSGVLEQERKKSAMTILAPYQNSLRHYRKAQGRILLMFMKEYIPENTMIRILGPGTEKFIPFIKQDDTIKFDVIIDTAPTSPNLKQEVWMTMQTILPALLQAGIPVPPSLLDYSPLPASVVEDWKKYIEEQSGMPPEAQKQIDQIKQQLQKVGQENQKLKEKKEEKMRELEMKQTEMNMDFGMDQKKQEAVSNSKQQEMFLDKQVATAKAENERNKMQAQATLAREKMELESTLAREQAEIDAALALYKAKLDAAVKAAGQQNDADHKKAEKPPTIDIPGLDELIKTLNATVKAKGDDTDVKQLIAQLNKPKTVTRDSQGRIKQIH